MKWRHSNQLLFATALIAAGCGDLTGDTTVSSSAVIGDRLPGLQAEEDLLEEAEEAFAANENINDGLGPIFNETGCGACHTNGAMGGAGEQIERRFGRFVNGIFDPLANRGGSLRQLFTVANFNNPNLPAGSRGRCQPGNPTLWLGSPGLGRATGTRLTTPRTDAGCAAANPSKNESGIASTRPSPKVGVVRRPTLRTVASAGSRSSGTQHSVGLPG